MTVRYIRVKPVSDMFAPAIRAYGTIAIVGKATGGAENAPMVFTNPADAKEIFPGDLGNSIAMAFQQTPGPTLVYGIRVQENSTVGWDAALEAVSALDVQFVVLANTKLDDTTTQPGNPDAKPPVPAGAIQQLADHVISVSNTGGDGKERMGVAMLEKGTYEVENLPIISNERMVYIAHKSDEDAAAAVAGVIAGYEPHISILLKPVNINTGPFTPAEIYGINGSETFNSGPAGHGVNWFTDPALIPGRGIYMGEGYTGDPGSDKKYIDIVRTIDDVSFRLKARLIKSIGALRISRAGLRTLTAQMEAVLEPLVRNEVIEAYTITIPILTMLDKDPASLTDAEKQQIDNAQAERVVEVLIAVDYAGAIHRLAITLKFE